MDLGFLRGGVIWWAVAIALALVMGVANRRAKHRLDPEKLAVLEREEKARAKRYFSALWWTMLWIPLGLLVVFMVLVLVLLKK